MSQTNHKFFILFISAIAATLAMSVSFQSLLAAWQAPAASPPTCAAGNPGCDAPLNTGAGAQTKQGGLNITGNVGIGTANSGYKLDVNGDLRATGQVLWGESAARTEYKNDAGALASKSGFFQTYAPANYYAGASSWQHLIENRHSNDGNNYALQIAGSFFDQNLYFRKTNNSPTTGWSKFIAQDSANNVYFPGSGIWNSSGYVGIGKTNPGQPLDVNGHIAANNSNALLYYQSGEGEVLRLTGNNGLQMHLENLNGTFRLVNHPWTAEIFNVDQSGNVGAAGKITAGTQLCIGADCKSGWSQVGGVKVFVGATWDSYDGAGVGGYDGGDAKCAAQFGAGARMCAANDFVNIRPWATGWYNTFQAINWWSVYHENDCAGWRSNDPSGSYIGKYWRVDDQIYGSMPYIGACRESYPILCCK